ncbi:PH domain-containing protein [Nocardia albiluteola]|uniref:PH domain-containing protein n=1 Tax=Nocardia albiluteola TaxID=2842303 RepID=UPI001FDA7451|nr:PH domain-containing protein [Nocardia albiluteola]
MRERAVIQPSLAEAPWRRLDRRMLLLHPVREVVRYIPVLVVTLIAGSRSDNPGWGLAVLALIVGLAVTRWFTTTYRIGSETVQLRRGLLRRKTLTVPRSRIRSVDVHADLMHRLLGLVVLAIGTGQRVSKEERFHLDGVDARQVPELRALLLREVESPAGQPNIVTSTPQQATGAEIGHWQPGWVRYAPLSLKGLAVIGPIVGVGFKFGIAGVLFNSHVVDRLGSRGVLFIAGVVAVLLVGLVVVLTLADCLRYLTTYFGLRVIDDGQTLHLRHGLFTTRQTTLDLARLRGATLKEPLLLRLAGGAELEAIMTGTSARQKLLPQAPRTAVHRTLAQLLAGRVPPGGSTEAQVTEHGSAATSPESPITEGGSAVGSSVDGAIARDRGELRGVTDDFENSATSAGRGELQPGSDPIGSGSVATAFGSPDGAPAMDAAAPAIVDLIGHGPRAHRRRFTRALSPLLVIALVMVVIDLAVVSIPPWAWVVLGVVAVLAVALAQDRYRGLGHAVIPGDASVPTWLITRHGSLDRDRDCLEAPGIIGWTVRQTFFQRRAGLATLVAATAAGKKRYEVIDVPLAQAWALIDAVTPGRLGRR